MDDTTCRRGHLRRINGTQVPQSRILGNPNDRHRWRCLKCEREWKAQHKEQGPYELDPVKVDRIVAGEWDGYVHTSERQEAIRILSIRYTGLSARQIACIVKCDPRTVQRFRAKIRTEERNG